MALHSGSSLPRETPPRTPRPLPRWIFIAWALTGVLLAAIAVLSIRRAGRTARADWESRLSQLADDRAALAHRALRQWREEARLLAELESVRDLFAASGAGLRAAADRVRSDLEETARADPSVAVGVTDAFGRVLTASSGYDNAGPEDPARRALEERQETLERASGPGAPPLGVEIAEPVFVRPGRPAGAVVVAADAAAALTQLFPAPSASEDERLVVVLRESDSLLVIAPHERRATGSVQRLPASNRNSLAFAALSAPRRSGEFVDGRGHRVLAASRQIPELGWAIVVTVDSAPVLAARRAEALWIVAASAAIFAAITAAGLAWRRAVRLRHLQQLSERDQRYRALLEQTQEAVSVAVNGKVTYANPACVEMFGYERPLLGVPVTVLFAPGSREQVDEIVKDRLRGRPAPEIYEAVGLRADGSTFDVEVRVTPVDFEDMAGYQAIFRDITGRKRMEAGLRESEERYRLLFERSLSGVYRSTLDGRILECNRAFATMLGYASPAEVMAQSASTLHANARDREALVARARREGSLVNHESRARRKDGSLIWVIENVSLLREEDGEETLLATVFDISERRRLEEQLLQSQKMEAVGRLAGGISHDFNNLLTAVSGYSELLLSLLPEGDPGRECAEEIRKAGQRAAGLTHQLLAFSRRQVLEPKVLDLNAVIANMERMLRRVIGEDVELTTALDPELWRARADPGQIEQAILNLVVNARDAMPRGGRLTIETANVEIDAQFARNYESVQPGSHVMVAVSDTGVGMDADLQSRLFEPFFTTKERGKGTGLGLSTTYGIVKQSGGSIWVYSEPGVGTTFKIYLPRSDEPLDTVAAPPAPAPRTGSETVLLVEDEPEVRRLVERLLKMQGYTVLAASGPAEAIAAAKGTTGALDLLLTDVILPGMNGRELARVLMEIRPELKVLYMSGYTDAAITQQGILEAGTAFLSKPFAPDALARKVREVLDADENLKIS